jgi:WD40 repeat protein
VGKEITHQVLDPSAVVYDSGGNRLVTFEGAEARIWDARTGEPIGKPMKTDWTIDSAEFHPDGQSLLTSGSNGTAYLWDAANGSPIGQPLRHVLQKGGSSSVNGFTARFSADGQRVLTASREQSDGTAKLWNSRTGELIGEPMKHPQSLTFAEFSPDGNRVVTATEGTVQVWDGENGRPVGEPIPCRNEVESVTFKGDGRWVLAKGRWFLRLIDTSSGKPAQEALSQLEGCQTLRFHPQRDWILATSEDGTANIWDLATGQLLGGPIRQQAQAAGDGGDAAAGAIEAAGFSPDGKRLVTRSDSLVETWDVRTGERIGSMTHDLAVRSMRLSSDGSLLLTIAGCFIHLWKATTGEPVGRPVSHPHPVESAFFTSDGARMVTRSNQTIRVFDVRVPVRRDLLLIDEERKRFSGSAMKSVRFSPDGRLLAIIGLKETAFEEERYAQVWDLRTGSRIASQADSNPTSPFIIRPRVAGPTPALIRAEIEFRRDSGGFVITAGNEIALLHTTERDKEVPAELSHDSRIIAVGFSPDGRQVLTAELKGAVRLWDSPTGQQIGQSIRDTDRITQARFSGDGRSIITCSSDGTARVRDTRTLTLQRNPFGGMGGNDRHLDSAQFNPHGSRYVVVSSSPPTAPPGQFPPPPAGTPPVPSDDGTGQLWDVTTGTLVGPTLRHPNGIRFARFSDDGRLLVTTSKDTACVWNAETGRLVNGPLRPDAKDGSVLEFARFSPNGKRLVTVAGPSARVWDCESGQPVGQPMIHRKAIRSMEFSGDGRRLATASSDGVARIWDVDRGLPLTGSLWHGDEIDSIALSPDGAMLVAASPVGPVRLWDLPRSSLPVPRWFVELAEALGGRRLSADGMIEEVSSDELLAIKQQVLAAPTTDRLHALAKWLLVNRSQGDPSPGPPWGTGPVEPGR